MYRKSHRYRMFTFYAIFKKHQVLGKGLYSEDKVIKALKSLLKNGLTLSR